MMMQPSPPPLGRAVSVIQHDKIPIRFLILDCPTENTLPLYLDIFLQHKVTTVVRCCQATYQPDLLLDYGIDLLDLPFRDGGVPNDAIVAEWLDLIDRYTYYSATDIPTIAVHCVAGLGRAPVLVALAFLEMGINPLDAIAFIRQRRRGAFNKLQINYLDQYRRNSKYRRLMGIHRRRSSASNSSASSSSSSFFSWSGKIICKLTHKKPPLSPQQDLQYYGNK
ncbi:protein-tyrosine phosphatase-like protein [Chlamydoabsidia padenii]|nr:protein-tyrosine phosphatase-like protein [Chlamydoabsidia padenii]